jgi:hypothetical protein
MSSDNDAGKIYADMQQSEANLHWTRNNYFLIASSIMLLALSQFHTRGIQIVIATLGFVMNLMWLLIQDRSSRYIGYWKKKQNEIDSTQGGARVNRPVFPEKLGGVQMRYVAYFLPILFMVIWLAIIVLASTIGLG